MKIAMKIVLGLAIVLIIAGLVGSMLSGSVFRAHAQTFDYEKDARYGYMETDEDFEYRGRGMMYDHMGRGMMYDRIGRGAESN